MDSLPLSAVDLVKSLTRKSQEESNLDRARVEAAIVEMLTAIGLPRRPLRWHDDAADAYTYLAQSALDSLTQKMSHGSAADDNAGTPAADLLQKFFDAAESAFDAGWANAWPKLVADCQSAAGKGGMVEPLQAMHRLLRPFMDSPSVAAVEDARLRGEAAIAGNQFEVRSEEIADLARDRVRRHQNNVADIIETFVPILAIGSVAPFQAAHVVARQAVAAWVSGGRMFWVRPNEVVIATVPASPARG